MDKKTRAMVSALSISALTFVFSLRVIAESTQSNDEIKNGFDCPIPPRADWHSPDPLTEKWFQALVANISSARQELHQHPITKEVSCTFNILEDGNLYGLHVSKKSGDAEIDKQAIKILERAQPIATPPAQLLKKAILVKFTSDSRVEVFFFNGLRKNASPAER